MMEIDALGDVCPLPVIKAKKALKENSEVMIVVDNEIATQNLMKMAEQMGLQVKIEKNSETVFQVFIFPEDSSWTPNVQVHSAQEKPYIVVINGKTMGSGNEELGYLLLKGFIYSLTEQDILPVAVIFYNGGAELTTTDSDVLEDLTTLREANVEILTCGACLNYFKLEEKLAVGEVTNMYHILSLMTQYHVVSP